MRIGIATSIATAIAIGVVIATGGGGGSPAPGLAMLWIDTNGGSCTRSATAIAYVDATACASIDAAYDAASCADVVLVKAGSYTSQTVTGTKSCSATWTMGTAHGVTCSSCVAVGVAPEESVTLSGLATTASYLIIERDDGTDLNIGGWNPQGANNSVIVRDADMTSSMFMNVCCGTGNGGPYDNIALVGGTMGDFNVGDSSHSCSSPCPAATAIYFQTAGVGSSAFATDILIDGVSFHDILSPGFIPEPDFNHTGVIRIDGGYSRVTIRNNDFFDNIDVSSNFISHSAILSEPPPTEVIIASNYFGSPGEAFGALGYYVTGTYCGSHRILYNTFVGTNPFQSSSCTDTGMIWSGNLGPKPSACMGTQTNNVWQTAGSGCGGTDTTTSGSLGLGGSNGFELQEGSIAIEAGETTYCPTQDHDGNSRPAPPATDCDAGADEVGDAELANLWVDTDGGTCTRSGTLVAYDNATACVSFAAAHAAASCGDIVNVKPGSYSAQTVAGGPTCAVGNEVTFINTTDTATLPSVDVEGIGVVLDHFTINDSPFIVDRLTIRNSYMNGFWAGGDVAQAVAGDGPDDWTLDSNEIDGQTDNPRNQIGDHASGWTITNNDIHDVHTSVPEDHTEGIWVGSWTDDGLIAGNTFLRNGNTAHIFLTWFDAGGSPGMQPSGANPQNICIRDNTFTDGYNEFFDINTRDEITTSTTTGVIYDTDNVYTEGRGVDQDEFEGDCG